MGVSISNVYVNTFETNLRHLAQQSQTKLRSFVTERAAQSENHAWDRLGTATAATKSGVLQATPVANLAWSRRLSVPTTRHAGEAVEQEDPVQMLIDPNSNVTMSLAMAMKREVDNIIIDAATGLALDGDGTTTTALPAGQTIGTGVAAIDFATVTQVQEKFMANDIDPDVPKVMVVGPVQVRQLMSATEQTSKDYVRAGLDQLSSTGIVPNWMGFTWVMSNLLNSNGAGKLSCLAFTNRAIGLQVNRDITARVAEDPTVSFAWRLYCYMTMGAVRVEDEHIVEIDVLDS